MTQVFMTHPQLHSRASTGVEVPANLQIRQATDADATALTGLMSAAYAPEAWDEARVRRELLDDPEVPAVWIAELGGELVATASERYQPARFPGSGYLHYVASSPAHAGQGLGRIMTEQVMDRVQARGFATCVLETDDFRIPALITYLRLGFIPSYRSEGDQLVWSQIFGTLFAAKGGHANGATAHSVGGAAR